MSSPRTTRRAVAEINFGEGQAIRFTAGNRSLHQLWHLFSAQFRHVLLAPQRRPDSGRVAWMWRELVENRPVTATELAEVRRRLSEASRSLAGGFGGLGSDDESPGSGGALEKQVHASVEEMVEELVGHRDLVFTKFVCRTDAGLMVHSWGGAVAAVPHYPDTQNGEISGSVMAGNEKPAGVSVVLENMQGGLTARVKSDADGSFRFPNVAAGNYRVRVADRSDFPPEGLTVTMEREAITGLELRSTAAESAAAATVSTAPINDRVPWYRRRLLLWLCLLVVAGLGTCVWRSTRPDAAESGATPKHSTGWQSASGQLAGGVSTNEPVDTRKVGGDGAWTTLKSSTPLPAATTSRSPHLPATGAGAGDRSALSPAEAASTDDRTKEAKPGNFDLKEKASALAAKSALTKPSDRSAAASARSDDGELPTDRPAENGQEGERDKPTESKLAKTLGGTSGKKSSAALSPGAASTDEAPSEAALAAGGETATDPASSPPAGGVSSAKKSGATKNAAAAPSSGATPASEEKSEELAPQAGSSAAQANGAGQLKASPGPTKKEKTDGLVDNTPAAAAGTQAAVAQSGETPVDSIESNPAVGKTKPPAPGPKKTATKQSPSPAESGAESAPENSSDDSTAAAKKPVNKKAAPAPATYAGPQVGKAADAAAATQASSEEDASANEAAPAGTGSGSSNSKAKAPAKKASSTSAPSATNAESPGESPAADATRGSERVEARVGDPGGPLVQVARVRATPWKARLMQDLILPTRPVTAAEEEALEDMRRKLLAESSVHMPAAFRQPRVTSGFVLEYSSASGLPRWRDESGVDVAGATVSGNRAELSWPTPAALQGKTYILSLPNGRELARVAGDQTGVPLLKVASGARAWCWFGVEGLPATSGFDWRLLSGAAVPASWGRVGSRVEIPLDATSARTGNYGVTLVDPKSGWALASDIALQ